MTASTCGGACSCADGSPSTTAVPGPARATAIIGLLLGGLGAGPLSAADAAAAQTVRGTVMDADRGQPVVGAAVVLADTASATLDSTVTDSAGRFYVSAPRPGRFIVHVALEGYLSYSSVLELDGGEDREIRVEMPLVSTGAARVMQEVIRRESAFQLPWEELCGEPVRPWEAGVLVGVSRDRRTMDPLPRAAVRIEIVEADDPAAAPWRRTRVSTPTGGFWFCNVPPGRVRMVARADGFAPDTSFADIRAGTISWYDALLRPRP